jgi:tetratricopeptide (TPR) repeat protein
MISGFFASCGPSAKNLVLTGDEKKNTHDYNGAIADYSQALSNEPTMFQAWHNRGECQMNLNLYDLAIKDFNEALAIKPDFPATLFDIGICYLKLKKYPEALEKIEKAHQKDTSIKANTALAECYFYTGKNHSAINYFDAALHDTPDSVALYLGRSISNFQLGYIDESKSDIAVYIQKGGTDPVASRQMGLIYLKTSAAPGMLDSAVFFLDQYKTKVVTPDKEAFKALVLSHLLRGKLMLSNDKAVEAMADFSKVIELEPNHAEALFERGKILISVGQNTDGCIDLQNALKNGNTNAEKLIGKYCNEIL